MRTVRIGTTRAPSLLLIASLVVALMLSMTASFQLAAAAPQLGLLIDSSIPGYAANASYSLRGVALSPDGSMVYVTWLHTGNGKKIVAYDTTTGAVLQSTSVDDTANGGASAVQVKSIAVDSRGYVFAGTGDDGTAIPFVRAYSADLQTAYGSITTPGDANIVYKRFGGLAAWDNGGNHYLYATRESGNDGFYIQRFNVNDVNNLMLDPSFGTGGTVNLQDVLGDSIGHPHGIVVASDGTIYVASFNEAATPSDTNGTVYKIAADGSSATSTSVPGAFDVALFGNTLYVTEYGEGAYPAIAKLDPATLGRIGSIDSGYTNTNTSHDSGYSGIDISAQGNIYLADQFYSSTAYSDRLIVLAGPPLISNVVATPNPAQVNSPVSITADVAANGDSTIVSANVSTGSCTSWSAMSAGDGTFDSSSEQVTATLNSGTDVGTVTLCIRATDSSGNTGSVTASFSVTVTPASLCSLTQAYAGDTQAASQLCHTLALIQSANLSNNSHLKTALVNVYIRQLNIQDGRGMTPQEINTLTTLVHDL